MREADVPVQGIVGTSIGALVGACFALGRTVEQVETLARSLGPRDILRVNRRVAWINGIRAQSVFKGEPLRAFVARALGEPSWDDLVFPLLVNAVDLETGRTEWFGPGERTDVSLVDAVWASASLPVLYPPVHVAGQWLVDGGVDEMLPLQRAADEGATGLIAVDPGAGAQADAAEAVGRGMVGIHERVFAIMAGRRRREAVASWAGPPPLVFVRPPIEGYSGFDFERIDFFMEAGYEATRRALGGAQRPAATGP